MNYFEKTGYSEKQNKKDLTLKEVKNLPLYVMTNAGHVYRGDSKVSKEAINSPCYIARVSNYPVALYFFEKATVNNMKGVKLYLTLHTFSRAKDLYNLALDGVFITPDWKVYKEDGTSQIKINAYNDIGIPTRVAFQFFGKFGHDLRIVGEFKERTSNITGSLLSPATVEILKEAGFDMGSMRPSWQFNLAPTYKVPEDSYSTGWFVENLLHPNRVVRRRKEEALIKHNFEYYNTLMGDKNFLLFEENGQVYIAQKYDTYYNLPEITVSYLKMPGRKESSCFRYGRNDSTKLRDGSFSDIIRIYDKSTRETIEKVLTQLLSKKQLLEKTEVLKNLIPTLEEAKALFKVDPSLGEHDYLLKDLSYLLSPVGQRDRVFEETIKQNGLGRGISARSFLRIIGDDKLAPSMKKKTPYGQVGLTKSAYYGLRKLIDSGVSINLKAMIKGVTRGIESWSYLMDKKEYLSKRTEFCKYLTADFIDLLGRTVSAPYNRSGISFRGPSADFWQSALRLAGKTLSSPLSEKITSLTKVLKKFSGDPSLTNDFVADVLSDYYRQVDELAPLGLNWPQKYEEFNTKNILWFLGTIRGHDDLVNRAKIAIPNASFVQRIKNLHDLQNQISALNKLEIEKATLRQMDEEYAPWKEQLEKALAWKGQNLGIFIPKSLAELTLEGSVLHHCVGSYKRDVALRKEGILFLRKLSCPDMPYYTLDVVKGDNGKYQVRQCHGNCNSNPTPEIVEALKQWATDTGKVDEESIKNYYRALCCL